MANTKATKTGRNAAAKSINLSTLYARYKGKEQTKAGKPYEYSNNETSFKRELASFLGEKMAEVEAIKKVFESDERFATFGKESFVEKIEQTAMTCVERYANNIMSDLQKVESGSVSEAKSDIWANF